MELAQLLYFIASCIVLSDSRTACLLYPRYGSMSDKELQQKLTIETNPQTQLRILIELNTRQARQITALTNRIAILEDKALKKAGRKRVPIYLDGRELTDDDILYYIDEDYYTIVELERVTKAPKNLIRNRYNRAKKKQRIAKEDTIPSFV